MDAPSPPRQNRSEARQRTHQALLAAARDVLFRLGYQGATLDRIAAEAGYTKGAVYWHFKNKEALFLELLADALAENLAGLDAMMESAGDDPDVLQHAAARYLEQVDRTIPLLALELDIESRRNPSLAGVYRQIIGEHQAALRRLLDRYYATVGRPPPLPVEQLATLILALAEAVVLSYQTRPADKVDYPAAVKLLLGVPREG